MKLTVEDILGLSEEEYIMVYDESKEEYFKDKNGYNMTYKVDAKESIIKWIHL